MNGSRSYAGASYSGGIPLAPGTGSAGSSPQAARADHSHGLATFTPDDHGLLAWTFDPVLCANSAQVGNASTLYRFKIKIPVAMTISNIHILVTGAGTTMTAGQNFAALYSSAKARLSVTDDQTTAWGSTGHKTMALTTPQAVAAGVVYGAFWMNGTSLPTLARATALASYVANPNLSAANSRHATANGSLTTTGPATIGSETASSQAFWMGLS